MQKWETEEKVEYGIRWATGEVEHFGDKWEAEQFLYKLFRMTGGIAVPPVVVSRIIVTQRTIYDWEVIK